MFYLYHYRITQIVAKMQTGFRTYLMKVKPFLISLFFYVIPFSFEPASAGRPACCKGGRRE